MEAEMEAAKPVDELQAAALREEAREFDHAYGPLNARFDRELFPTSEYEQRNGASRKDGYWAYVGKGEEAPLDFTYGEFPLPLFTRLVDRACELGYATRGRHGRDSGGRYSSTHLVVLAEPPCDEERTDRARNRTGSPLGCQQHRKQKTAAHGLCTKSIMHATLLSRGVGNHLPGTIPAYMYY